jgi:predicted transposase/invertase (TIGR01784 family)
MQNRKVPNFIKRSQFYVSNAYASQLGDAVDYLDLKPVILLTIANHILFPVKKDYISYHKTLDTKTHEHDLEDLAYAFVELPKFKKTEQDLKTTEDQWLYMFKNYDKMKTIPKEIPEEIQEAYKTLEQFSWSLEEKEAYDRARISLADEFDALRDATEEGIVKGIAKGKIEEKKSIASLLLAKGFSDKDILEITKITPQELKQLKSEIKEKR